ncbi:MAG: peptide chain release factor 1 [Flavobacteriales bacterium]|nr:peptide chain release factor 1 [Flavobacteriales bacterium]
MLSKLQAIADRYREVSELITDPAVIADMKRYVKLNKEYKDLGPIVNAANEYESVLLNIDSTKEILRVEKDDEFREMAKAELEALENRKIQLDEEIKYMLIPKDPEDSKNAVVEVRAGTGGDEAGIFVGDVYRMYTRYFSKKGWNMEVLTVNESEAGGYKEVSFVVSGEDVFGRLKFESGVHRVQRVPETEAQGRVHTSAITVAVLPEADEVDVDINMNDVKKDVFRASGAGGQHVNRTESAVRLTHIPSGIVVECQDERSQIKNFERALKVLRSRLYDRELSKVMEERALKRKTMVSTGDRSAKIRTYNYPQGRVTDHRIGLTLYNLAAIMDGDLDELIDALLVAENAEKLKSGLE